MSDIDVTPLAPFEPDPVPTIERRRPPRWPFVLAILLLLAGLAVFVSWQIKVPYFAMSPGPVEEVSDLISIEDVPTFEPRGDLYLLTVGLREVNAFEWVEAQLDETIDLIERQRIRPDDVTEEQQTRTNLQLMDESIDTAVFVALTRLGYDVRFTGEGVEVLEIVEGAPADGVLEVGDVVQSVAGEPVLTADEAASQIRSFSIGDDIPLEVRRGDEVFTAEITLAPHPDLEGQPMVGVLLNTLDLSIVYPITVEVDSRNIGGPSAGLMYTLTLMNLLTEEDLTHGHRIAGTGTIRFDESVGSIGGVRQKVFAARAAGAEYVLVPENNYDRALTAAAEEIEIVSVATLQDALDFLDSLADVPAVRAAG